MKKIALILDGAQAKSGGPGLTVLQADSEDGRSRPRKILASRQRLISTKPRVLRGLVQTAATPASTVRALPFALWDICHRE